MSDVLTGISLQICGRKQFRLEMIIVTFDEMKCSKIETKLGGYM